MFEVIVSNIGNVYSGTNSDHAWEVYRSYVLLSQNPDSGRASGETVALFNGENLEAEHMTSKRTEAIDEALTRVLDRMGTKGETLDEAIEAVYADYGGLAFARLLKRAAQGERA
jgi:hypothetical protein